jgi:hypothetical protein
MLPAAPKGGCRNDLVQTTTYRITNEQHHG